MTKGLVRKTVNWIFLNDDLYLLLIDQLVLLDGTEKYKCADTL